MTPTKLIPTRLITTKSGDIQKIHAVTAEVITTITADRLDRLRRANNKANMLERSVKFGDSKHGPDKPSVPQKRKTVGQVAERAARGVVKGSTYKQPRRETIGQATEHLDGWVVVCLGVVLLLAALTS